jgi:hypothetical protein
METTGVITDLTPSLKNLTQNFGAIPETAYEVRIEPARGIFLLRSPIFHAFLWTVCSTPQLKNAFLIIATSKSGSRSY